MLGKTLIKGGSSIAVVVIVFAAASTAWGQAAIGPPVFAGIFGSRNLTVENPNNPGTNYTMVLHQQDMASNLAYNQGRGWGFEVIYPDPTTRPYMNPNNDGKQFGPFDDSANNRNDFADTLPDELYDSFIGFKDYESTCMVGNPPGITDMNQPCSPTIPASGGVFRIDVPNGQYRFVGAFGEADNVHAHRVLAENGGSGPPADGIGPHVVLVHNHDQAQWEIGQPDATEPGEGVFAAVGFLDKRVPQPQAATGPIPVFANMDANGMPAGGDGTAPPESPVLVVTEGYIRVHLLQGNSNDGPGGPRDPNGSDIVLFEVYPVGDELVPGDVNGDEMVDILDYEIIRDNYRITGAALADGDLNFDRTVDQKDFRIWKDAFNAGPAAVPEPGSLVLLLSAAALLGFRSRRRRLTV